MSDKLYGFKITFNAGRFPLEVWKLGEVTQKSSGMCWAALEADDLSLVLTCTITCLVEGGELCLQAVKSALSRSRADLVSLANLISGAELPEDMRRVLEFVNNRHGATQSLGRSISYVVYPDLVNVDGDEIAVVYVTDVEGNLHQDPWLILSYQFGEQRLELVTTEFSFENIWDGTLPSVLHFRSTTQSI